MKRKKINFRLAAAAAATMSLSLTFVSYAGEWKKDDVGWWYQHYDGSYVQSKPANDGETEIVCYRIDGNKDGISEYYYFDQRGYLYTNTELTVSTSSGTKKIKVNGDGARLKEDGSVDQVSVNQKPIRADLGKGVLKSQYVNLLMNDLETVEKKLGYTKEKRKYTDEGVLFLNSEETSPEKMWEDFSGLMEDDILTYMSGTVIGMFENPSITPEEISRILGVQPRSDKSNTMSFDNEPYRECIWTLQENPKIEMVLTGYISKPKERVMCIEIMK